jgi:sulfate permease, SulP family
MASNASWASIARDTTRSWRAMANRKTVMADVSAGLTVAMVAMPLNLALAVACGLPPHAGLMSGAVAGLVGALFGGGRFQITGPEVALAPITFAIVEAHGVTGLVTATVLAGVLQIVLGLVRVGSIVRAIPRPVVGGFMAAVGLLVFNSQLPRLLGLEGVHTMSSIRDPAVLLTASPSTLLIGGLVIATLLAMTRAPRGVPGPLVALVIAVGVTAIAGFDVPRIEPISSDASLFPAWPALDALDLPAIFPSALALAMLASIDSLLCAVSIDNRTRDRHDSDQELVAQGLANIASGLFGGMPAAAAIVRSVVAVEARAATRLTGVVQSAALALVVVALGAHLDHVPLAALAGVLLVVGAKLVQVRELRAVARVSRLEAGVFVATTVAILGLDFVPGVGVGIGLALAAFATNVRKQLRVSGIRSEGATRVVQIAGALFFGSQSRLAALVEGASSDDTKALVIDLRGVRVIDASGMGALRAAIEDLATDSRTVHVTGVPSGLVEALKAELGPSCATVFETEAQALAALRAGADAADDTPLPAVRPDERAGGRLSIGTQWVTSGE